MITPSTHTNFTVLPITFSVHVSSDGGRTWPGSEAKVLYPHGAAYSDMSWTKTSKRRLAFLFERDNYNTVAFGRVEAPAVAPKAAVGMFQA